MTAKSVLVRPQGLRTRARTPTCPPLFATPLVAAENAAAYYTLTIFFGKIG